MRLAQSKSGAVWVEADASAVRLSDAYRYACSVRGVACEEIHLTELKTIDGLLAARWLEDGWYRLDVMRETWLRGMTMGDERAADCIQPESEWLAPLRPRTFRDFYAFESHVKTCRARRGLEMVPEWYEMPVFYFSNPFAFVGPGAPIYAPRGSTELDFELEVACIIGKPGCSVRAQAAESMIAGYTILNDWSARDIQRAEVKVGLGPAKGKDFATSIGPYLVSPGELHDRRIHRGAELRHNLTMEARVNNRLISKGNLQDLHFTFCEMIERASADVWLMPGDVIGSGTVGTGCILELGPEVQPWLKPGDIVELEVERLGILSSPVVAHPQAAQAAQADKSEP